MEWHHDEKELEFCKNKEWDLVPLLVNEYIQMSDTTKAMSNRI